MEYVHDFTFKLRLSLWGIAKHSEDEDEYFSVYLQTLWLMFLILSFRSTDGSLKSYLPLACGVVL